MNTACDQCGVVFPEMEDGSATLGSSFGPTVDICPGCWQGAKSTGKPPVVHPLAAAMMDVIRACPVCGIYHSSDVKH